MESTNRNRFWSKPNSIWKTLRWKCFDSIIIEFALGKSCILDFCVKHHFNENFNLNKITKLKFFEFWFLNSFQQKLSFSRKPPNFEICHEILANILWVDSFLHSSEWANWHSWNKMSLTRFSFSKIYFLRFLFF